MKTVDFVHLHVHSDYSFDSICRLHELIKSALDCRMPALAITDHGNLFGAIKFYRQAKRAGVKPIIGCEVYVDRKGRFVKTEPLFAASFQLTLLAKNEVGYKNLIRLSSAGYLEGFHLLPRVDKNLLAECSEGIIALSGGLKGEIPYLINVERNPIQAKRVAGEFQDIFGKENFFLELNNQGVEGQEKVIQEMQNIGCELSIPLVATNNCHYINREDSQLQDVFLRIQTGKAVGNPCRMRFPTDNFYFKSPEEMRALFADIPKATSNTVEIAERCNLELTFGKDRFPHFKPSDGHSPDDCLKKLCLEGLLCHYPEPTPQVEERLKHELEVIQEMGYASYFLIAWDIIYYARQKGISVGPSRGSVGGSLVAYLLGITEVDPLRHGLLFERFLNRGRPKPPNIDIDFEDGKRGDIIDYLRMKYGDDRVAKIITFGTMTVKIAVRDVGRALNMPYAEVDKIAKIIPSEPNITLAQAMQKEPELREIAEADVRVKHLLTLAWQLEGIVRYTSTHATGVVISQEPFTDLVPLFKTTDGEVTTQYDADSLSDIGLLKLDIIEFKILTVINDTLCLIRKTRKENLNLKKIPLDDKKTFQLLSEAHSLGVFQLESPGMQGLLKRISVTKFDDIVAAIVLYWLDLIGREAIDKFISGKKGASLLSYDHPVLKPILDDTYGVILYQEQITNIVSKFAGFSLERSDIFRQEIGKKIPQVMDEQHQAFITGATENKGKKEIAEKVFDLISQFARYGFNKAHATTYALIAYQTAYLKANYTIEFMAALLTSKIGNTDKITTYINECQRMGIKVLLPNVNEGQLSFTVVGNDIRSCPMRQ